MPFKRIRLTLGNLMNGQPLSKNRLKDGRRSSKISRSSVFHSRWPLCLDTAPCQFSVYCKSDSYYCNFEYLVQYKSLEFISLALLFLLPHVTYFTIEIVIQSSRVCATKITVAYAYSDLPQNACIAVSAIWELSGDSVQQQRHSIEAWLRTSSASKIVHHHLLDPSNSNLSDRVLSDGS